MIQEIIENNKDFLKKEFQKNFNIEAKKQNSKFYIDYYNDRLILQRKGKWFVKDSFDIRFSKNKNAFCFIEPIEEKVFKEIKPILEIIPEKFIIEIVKGEKKDEK